MEFQFRPSTENLSLSLSLTKTTPVQSGTVVTDLLNASQDLYEAFENLTDAQKSMESVCEAMEDIQTSVDVITKYGAAGVEQLTITGRLKKLCNVEAKLLTVDAAQECLDKAELCALEGFVDAVKEFVQKVIAFINGCITKFRQYLQFGKDNETVKLLELLKDEQISSIISKLRDTGGSIGRMFLGPNNSLTFEFNPLFIDLGNSEAVRNCRDIITGFQTELQQCNQMLYQIEQGIDAGWLPGSALDGQVNGVINRARELTDKSRELFNEATLSFTNVADLQQKYNACDSIISTLSKTITGCEQFISNLKDYGNKMASKYTFSHSNGIWTHRGNPQAISNNVSRVVRAAERLLAATNTVGRYPVQAMATIQMIVRAIVKRSATSSAA